LTSEFTKNLLDNYKKIKGENMFKKLFSLLKKFFRNLFKKLFSFLKNLFRMNASTNKIIEDDDARWRRELDTAIGKLENDDIAYPSFEEKVWFYEQFYLFITDRTMAHPNPGIREDQEYNWMHPDIIRINNDREWFHPSHSDELKYRLNCCKDLYVQGKISIDEYCKERESIQKEDNNFRSHFRL